MFGDGYFLIKSKKENLEIIADCYDELWSLPDFEDRVSTEEMLKKYEIVEEVISKPKSKKERPRSDEYAYQKYQEYEYRVL